MARKRDKAKELREKGGEEDNEEEKNKKNKKKKEWNQPKVTFIGEP
jgi:hypothetical protein